MQIKLDLLPSVSVCLTLVSLSCSIVNSALTVEGFSKRLMLASKWRGGWGWDYVIVD